MLFRSSYVVHFLLEERLYAARCLEIGNFGASLLLSGEHLPASFPPNTALESLRIERSGDVVFETRWAHVQRAQQVNDAFGTHLQLDLSWATTTHPPPPVPGVTMEESAEVMATLRKALRREAIMWVQRAGDPSVQLCLEAAAVRSRDGLGVLEGHSASELDAVPGDDLDLFFEMGGQSYSGVCSLLERTGDGRMTLGLPRSLVIRNWRSLPRFKPVAGHRFLLSFAAPVTGQLTTRPVEDLSVGGLSFSFDASRDRKSVV